MSDIKKIIKDEIINKEKLVLKRYMFLNIDENQAMFISKVFRNENLRTDELSIEELSKIFGTTNETSEKIIKSLIVDGWIKVFYIEKNMKFDFSSIIKTLVESYVFPNKDTSIDKKIIWIKNTLNININKSNENKLKELIRNGEWNKIIIVSKKISNLNDQSWPLFESLYNSITLKESNEKNEIKELMDINWLEN